MKHTRQLVMVVLEKVSGTQHVVDARLCDVREELPESVRDVAFVEFVSGDSDASIMMEAQRIVSEFRAGIDATTDRLYVDDEEAFDEYCRWAEIGEKEKQEILRRLAGEEVEA